MPVRLSVDWVAVKEAVERGATYKDAAEQFGISHGSVMQRAHREGWKNTKARAAGRVAIALLRDKEALRGKMAERVADKASQQVAGVIAEVVSDAVRMSREIMNRSHESAMAAVSPRDLKDATIAFGISHQHARLALGMDRVDGLRSGQPWQQAQVIDIQTVKPSAPAPVDVKPIDA